MAAAAASATAAAPSPTVVRFLEAAAAGDVAVMTGILNSGGANINCSDEKGDNALMKAVRGGHRTAVTFLLDHKINVNHRSKAGSSALVASGMQGHADIASQLLVHGANINQRTDSLDSAVSLAVWKNHTDTALLLIAKGANVDTTDKFGESPLHDAAKHGNPKIMSALLTKLKHRINLRNGKGQTPLHLSAIHAHADALRMLLGIGADQTVLDDEKKSAYDHATNEEAIRVLAPNHLKQIESVLTDMKLKFEDKTNEDTPTFRFLLVKPEPIALQDVRLQLSRRASLIVYSTCTYRVPPPRRAHVAELLTRINFDLPTGGNFELDMRDGEVRYKSSFGFGKISDLRDMTRYFIGEHSTLFEPYMQAAMEVGKGAAPKELYQAFKKSHGL